MCPDEHRAENLRDVLEREPELHMVLPRSVASAVIEHDRGKRAATCGLPQEAFQLKTTTTNLDSVRLWPFNDLRGSRAGNPTLSAFKAPSLATTQTHLKQRTRSCG